MAGKHIDQYIKSENGSKSEVGLIHNLKKIV